MAPSLEALPLVAGDTEVVVVVALLTPLAVDVPVVLVLVRDVVVLVLSLPWSS